MLYFYKLYNIFVCCGRLNLFIIPTGKLQKAEYILSSLIYNSGATGKEAVAILLPAVSVCFHAQYIH